MATKINMISTNGNQTITQTLSNVNETVADSDISQFVVGLAGLSNNTLTKIEKIEFSPITTPYSIIGGNSADTIFCNDYAVTIDAGRGNDVISLGADALNCTINGGHGNNTIYGNGGGHVYINEAGSLSSGSDTIFGFSGDDVIVKPFPVFIAGESFTSIPGANVKLKAAKKANATGDTADDFDNFASGDILKAIGIDGKLNSYAVLSAPVTLAAGGTNTVNNSYIYLDAAGGTFTNSADNVYITTSDSLNNTIHNTGDHVFISVGAGADSIYNSGDNVVINGGNGADYISNNGEFVSITGSGDANTVSTSKGNVTLYGGTSNGAVAISTATDKPVVFQVNGGNYSKKITGFKEGDFIYYNNATSSPFSGTVKGSTDGSYITFGTNDNSTIYAAAGYSFDINHGCTLLLRGDKPGDENLTVVYPRHLYFEDGGVYNFTGVAKAQDYYFNSDAGTTINNAMSNALLVLYNSANNSITSSGDAVTIYGGEGNDTINLVNANANTVLAGAGEDVISISGTSSNNSIYGGAGADSIISNGNHNIFWYAGNANESSMTGSENISDSIKGFNTDNDKIFVRNTKTTVTSATVEAGAQLTLTNGARVTNILLEGKGSNDTIKILWGSATDERLYAIGSTADNSSGWIDT